MARVLFFGKLGEAAGGKCRDMKIPGDVKTIKDLVNKIAADDDILGVALNNTPLRFVVNEVVRFGDVTITDEDEIAFLPPVSGG